MPYFRSSTITFSAAINDLATGSPTGKIAAARALADISDPSEQREASDALIPLLAEDVTEALRAAAAQSLGELGQVSAVGPLTEALDANEPSVRQLAAISLGRLGFAEGFVALATALTESPPDVRFQAARSLVEIDPERSAAPLLAAIGREDDNEVIGALALGLGEIGDVAATDAIAAHLGSPRPETQFEVAYALALLRDPRGLGVLALGTQDREHAWDAIEGLELIANGEAADALAAVVRRPRVAPELSLRSASALLAIDSDHAAAADARSALVGGLSAWKHHLRGLAVGELERVGGSWALNELRRLQTRRRGAVLLDEINDAIAAISSRNR